VLLSGAKPEDAERKVEDVRQVVAGIGIQSFDKPLSASIGVAHFPTDGGDAERLLAEADRLMYQQKRSRKHHRAGALSPTWTRDSTLTSVH
jgi:GGDEF domain-containing protein